MQGRIFARLAEASAELKKLDLDNRLPADLESRDPRSLDPSTILFLIEIALVVRRLWKLIKED